MFGCFISHVKSFTTCHWAEAVRIYPAQSVKFLTESTDEVGRVIGVYGIDKILTVLSFG